MACSIGYQLINRYRIKEFNDSTFVRVFWHNSNIGNFFKGKEILFVNKRGRFSVIGFINEVFKEDENYEKLFRFGSALGKYIYTVDAICDLKSDIKKQRYNPLRLCDSGSFDDTVSLLMADVVSSYAALGIKEEKKIIENVLFSGILLKYKAFGRKKNGTRPL